MKQYVRRFTNFSRKTTWERVIVRRKRAHIAKYRDFLPWAVQKRRNRSALSKPTTQTPSWSVLSFAQMTAECPYTSQWDVPSPPLKNVLPMGDLELHLIHGSLGPSESSTQTRSESVQSFCKGSVSLLWQTERQFDRLTYGQTDWQTDKPRYSVGNNRPQIIIYVVRAMRANNNN